MALKTVLCVALCGLAGVASAAGRPIPSNLMALYDHAKVPLIPPGKLVTNATC